MRLLSLNILRSAGAAALALGAGLAQAHEGHRAPPMHTHVDVDGLLASTSAILGAAAPFATALAVLALAAFCAWQWLRRRPAARD